MGLRQPAGQPFPRGRSVVRVTAPVRPAPTPDLATAWMAVVKSGVRPRQATLEAPMLPAHHGARRRLTSRTSPAAPSSERARCSSSLANRRPMRLVPVSSRPRDDLPPHERARARGPVTAESPTASAAVLTRRRPAPCRPRDCVSAPARWRAAFHVSRRKRPPASTSRRLCCVLQTSAVSA